MKRSLKSTMKRRRMKRRRLADGQWWSDGAELYLVFLAHRGAKQHKPRAVRPCQRMLRG